MRDKKSLKLQIERWIERDPDAGTREQIAELLTKGHKKELESLFEGRLQFGTAGIRGIVGPGPMRMNRLVIRETSAGLASYLLDSVANAAQRGIVVSYDARPDSRQFAEDAASVFLGAGIKVFITKGAQPTPVGAFAVHELGAAAGIVVTASHNPPEYNGYKVYWENAAQIIPPHDAAIAARIEQAASSDIPWTDIESANGTSAIHWMDSDFIDNYCARVSNAISSWADRSLPEISIAYTALHGVGARIAASLMQDAGVTRFYSVASQHDPDGSFPTVSFPNPEEPGAMDAVIALAAENNCALACANDPDADRLAIAARTANGDYQMLSGDQIGILLGSYCLSKTEPTQQIVCASMVSSRMLGRIAEAAQATYFETLTGFKWLSNIALQNETDDKHFLFAYEEALGYALGQLVRDKDGLSALSLFVQMARELTTAGRTIFDELESLYMRHGLFLTEQRSIRTQPGQASITESLRNALPTSIAGINVTSTKDLLYRRHRFADGREEPLDSIANDVLMFYLADDSRVIVRPSGTEPKTKCYYEVVGNIADAGSFAAAASETRNRLERLANGHQKALADYCE